TGAATRRWGTSGTTSTSRPSAVRKFGKTRQRVIPSPSRTSGGIGTTTTPPRPRLTKSGSRCPTPGKPTSRGSATNRRKHDRKKQLSTDEFQPSQLFYIRGRTKPLEEQMTR